MDWAFTEQARQISNRALARYNRNRLLTEYENKKKHLPHKEQVLFYSLSWKILPALFSDAGFNSSKGFLFTQHGSKFVPLTIITLCHITASGSFSDHCVFDLYTFFLGLYVICGQFDICQFLIILNEQ